MNAASQNRTAGRGAVALLTVIILGALVLVVGLSAARVGQTEVIIAGQLDRGHHARTMAMSCAEDALYRLKLDSSYVGGALSLGEIECTVEVTGSGDTRTVVARAVSGDYTQSVTVNALLRRNQAGNARGWSVDTWQDGGP